MKWVLGEAAEFDAHGTALGRSAWHHGLGRQGSGTRSGSLVRTKGAIENMLDSLSIYVAYRVCNISQSERALDIVE